MLLAGKPGRFNRDNLMHYITDIMDDSYSGYNDIPRTFLLGPYVQATCFDLAAEVSHQPCDLGSCECMKNRLPHPPFRQGAGGCCIPCNIASLQAFLLQDRFFEGQYDEMVDAMRCSADSARPKVLVPTCSTLVCLSCCRKRASLSHPNKAASIKVVACPEI